MKRAKCEPTLRASLTYVLGTRLRIENGARRGAFRPSELTGPDLAQPKSSTETPYNADEELEGMEPHSTG